MKLAVIISRDFPTEKVFVPVDKATVILIGDANEQEEAVREQARAAGVPVVLFRPYFKVDKHTKFNPSHFFAANRQKVQNADHVLIFRSKEDETVAAEEYARKINVPVTTVVIQ